MSAKIETVTEMSLLKFPKNPYTFDTWMLRLCAHLDARGLWEAVLGKDKTEKAAQNAVKAYLIILQLLPDRQVRQIANVKQGDAEALMKRLDSIYGLNCSTESKIAMYDKLKNLTKEKHENIHDMIARIDELIANLTRIGETVSDTQRLTYVLSALETDDAWKDDVKLIKKMSHDAAWNSEKLNKYLISEEHMIMNENS